MQDENHLIKERKKKLQDLRDMGVNPYAYSYDTTHHAKKVLELFQDELSEGEFDETVVKIAGRVMQKRDMGKASFIHIEDRTGKVQAYFRQDTIGEDNYKIFQKVDIGDFIGVEGNIFKTKKGEVTINVTSFKFLTKTIRPLPEKYHGLQDHEIRYRQRYLDLMMNQDVRVTFQIRAKIISLIREYLNSRGFMEVDTPTLQTMYGGANARPFITRINAWDMDMYLSISPELYLKRLMVGGMEKVYTICKNFRNEGVDKTHNPEFTMLEYYWAYVDYDDVMKMTEEMVEYVTKQIHGTTKIHYQGQDIDVKAPWERLTMKEALKRFAEIDSDQLSDDELFDLRTTYNIEYEGDLTRGVMIQLLFEELCEDKLIQPVHIIDHPQESTPLCKSKRGDSGLIERFESYINGTELTNGYSELNDPIVQKELLQKQADQLRAGMEEAHPMDDDFVKAIEYGMPPTGGLGLGVDRLVMLLTDEPSLRDVILFPTMKPLK